MTDKELAAAAWNEFKQADRPWSQVAGYSPSRLSRTHWGKGKAYLDMIGRNVVQPPAAPPSSVFPDPPLPPSESNYSIPAGATVVTTQAQLDTALAGGTAVDIKVMNGTYSRATPSSPAAAHRVWCESATGVIFNYGFDFAYKTAWEFHGGKFLILDRTHSTTAGGAYAALLGYFVAANTNAKVSDVTIDGNNIISDGVHLIGVDGCQVNRVVVTNVTDYGVFLSDNDYYSTLTMASLTDINCSGIRRATPGSAGGTAEAGLWLGNSCDTTVRRMKFRDLGWMGAWTGATCWGTGFSDIDVDDNGHNATGVYNEHNTINCTFDRMLIGSGISTGVINEWDYSSTVGLNGSHSLPTGTILVNETIVLDSGSGFGFLSAGTFTVGNPGDTAVTVTYTGFTNSPSPRFTGCTGGTGTWGSATLVVRNRSALPTWGCSYTNSRINAASVGLFMDNGTMRATVTGCTFTNCASAAIKDRTNNPQATSAANSSLTQSGNSFGSTPGIVYG